MARKSRTPPRSIINIPNVDEVSPSKAIAGGLDTEKRIDNGPVPASEEPKNDTKDPVIGFKIKPNFNDQINLLLPQVKSSDGGDMTRSEFGRASLLSVLRHVDELLELSKERRESFMATLEYVIERGLLRTQPK